MSRDRVGASRRKGAVRTAEVPDEVLEGLNSGELQSATLAEGLAVDFVVLMRHVLPELADEVAARVDPSAGITRRMAAAGALIYDHLGTDGFRRLVPHPSDTVRGWAAYLLAAVPDLDLQERLEEVRTLADDEHFGVREWAWLALRPHVARDVRLSVAELEDWVEEDSPNLRRFAVEITRPRGVWSAHIKELKEEPAKGLPLLEPLKDDLSRYVQDSVGNWLNDAAKSRPEWVISTTERWLAESASPRTARICARALRSLEGKPTEQEKA